MKFREWYLVEVYRVRFMYDLYFSMQDLVGWKLSFPRWGARGAAQLSGTVCRFNKQLVNYPDKLITGIRSHTHRMTMSCVPDQPPRFSSAWNDQLFTGTLYSLQTVKAHTATWAMLLLDAHHSSSESATYC